MNFNSHSELRGLHAFLSASKYHWVNYSEEKLVRSYIAALAAVRGTDLHNLAHEAIRLGVRFPTSKTTINMYVNDGIGYGMTCEQVLFYSENCFGTADTISFKRNKLRIHDLKTGLVQTNETQLKVYAAMFCLEYHVKPHQIEMELRIYQNDEKRIYEPDPDEIVHIMDRIVTFDKLITEKRSELMS